MTLLTFLSLAVYPAPPLNEYLLSGSQKGGHAYRESVKWASGAQRFLSFHKDDSGIFYLSIFHKFTFPSSLKEMKR